MILLHICLEYSVLLGFFQVMGCVGLESNFVLIGFGSTSMNTYWLSSSFVAQRVFKTWFGIQFWRFFRQIFIDTREISDHGLQVEDLEVISVFALGFVASWYGLMIKGGLLAN